MKLILLNFLIILKLCNTVKYLSHEEIFNFNHNFEHPAIRDKKRSIFDGFLSETDTAELFLRSRDKQNEENVKNRNLIDKIKITIEPKGFWSHEMRIGGTPMTGVTNKNEQVDKVQTFIKSYEFREESLEAVNEEVDKKTTENKIDKRNDGFVHSIKKRKESKNEAIKHNEILREGNHLENLNEIDKEGSDMVEKGIEIVKVKRIKKEHDDEHETDEYDEENTQMVQMGKIAGNKGKKTKKFNKDEYLKASTFFNDDDDDNSNEKKSQIVKKIINGAQKVMKSKNLYTKGNGKYKKLNINPQYLKDDLFNLFNSLESEAHKIAEKDRIHSPKSDNVKGRHKLVSGKYMLSHEYDNEPNEHFNLSPDLDKAHSDKVDNSNEYDNSKPMKILKKAAKGIVEKLLVHAPSEARLYLDNNQKSPKELNSKSKRHTKKIAKEIVRKLTVHQPSETNTDLKENSSNEINIEKSKKRIKKTAKENVELNVHEPSETNPDINENSSNEVNNEKPKKFLKKAAKGIAPKKNFRMPSKINSGINENISKEPNNEKLKKFSKKAAKGIVEKLTVHKTSETNPDINENSSNEVNNVNPKKFSNKAAKGIAEKKSKMNSDMNKNINDEPNNEKHKKFLKIAAKGIVEKLPVHETSERNLDINENSSNEVNNGKPKKFLNKAAKVIAEKKNFRIPSKMNLDMNKNISNEPNNEKHKKFLKKAAKGIVEKLTVNKISETNPDMNENSSNEVNNGKPKKFLDKASKGIAGKLSVHELSKANADESENKHLFQISSIELENAKYKKHLKKTAKRKPETSNELSHSKPMKFSKKTAKLIPEKSSVRTPNKLKPYENNKKQEPDSLEQLMQNKKLGHLEYSSDNHKSNENNLNKNELKFHKMHKNINIGFSKHKSDTFNKKTKSPLEEAEESFKFFQKKFGLPYQRVDTDTTVSLFILSDNDEELGAKAKSKLERIDLGFSAIHRALDRHKTFDEGTNGKIDKTNGFQRHNGRHDKHNYDKRNRAKIPTYKKPTRRQILDSTLEESDSESYIQSERSDSFERTIENEIQSDEKYDLLQQELDFQDAQVIDISKYGEDRTKNTKNRNKILGIDPNWDIEHHYSIEKRVKRGGEISKDSNDSYETNTKAEVNTEVKNTQNNKYDVTAKPKTGESESKQQNNESDKTKNNNKQLSKNHILVEKDIENYSKPEKLTSKRPNSKNKEYSLTKKQSSTKNNQRKGHAKSHYNSSNETKDSIEDDSYIKDYRRVLKYPDVKNRRSMTNGTPDYNEDVKSRRSFDDGAPDLNQGSYNYFKRSGGNGLRVRKVKTFSKERSERRNKKLQELDEHKMAERTGREQNDYVEHIPEIIPPQVPHRKLKPIVSKKKSLRTGGPKDFSEPITVQLGYTQSETPIPKEYNNLQTKTLELRKIKIEMPNENPQTAFKESPYREDPYKDRPYEDNPYKEDPYKKDSYKDSPYKEEPYKKGPYKDDPYKNPRHFSNEERFKNNNYQKEYEPNKYGSREITPTENKYFVDKKVYEKENYDKEYEKEKFERENKYYDRNPEKSGYYEKERDFAEPDNGRQYNARMTEASQNYDMKKYHENSEPALSDNMPVNKNNNYGKEQLRGYSSNRDTKIYFDNNNPYGSRGEEIREIYDNAGYYTKQTDDKKDKDFYTKPDRNDNVQARPSKQEDLMETMRPPPYASPADFDRGNEYETPRHVHLEFGKSRNDQGYENPKVDQFEYEKTRNENFKGYQMRPDDIRQRPDDVLETVRPAMYGDQVEGKRGNEYEKSLTNNNYPNYPGDPSFSVTPEKDAANNEPQIQTEEKDTYKIQYIKFRSKEQPPVGFQNQMPDTRRMTNFRGDTIKEVLKNWMRSDAKNKTARINKDTVRQIRQNFSYSEKARHHTESRKQRRVTPETKKRNRDIIGPREIAYLKEKYRSHYDKSMKKHSKDETDSDDDDEFSEETVKKNATVEVKKNAKFEVKKNLVLSPEDSDNLRSKDTSRKDPHLKVNIMSYNNKLKYKDRYSKVLPAHDTKPSKSAQEPYLTNVKNNSNKWNKLEKSLLRSYYDKNAEDRIMFLQKAEDSKQKKYGLNDDLVFLHDVTINVFGSTVTKIAKGSEISHKNVIVIQPLRYSGKQDLRNINKTKESTNSPKKNEKRDRRREKNKRNKKIWKKRDRSKTGEIVFINSNSNENYWRAGKETSKYKRSKRRKAMFQYLKSRKSKRKFSRENSAAKIEFVLNDRSKSSSESDFTNRIPIQHSGKKTNIMFHAADNDFNYQYQRDDTFDHSDWIEHRIDNSVENHREPYKGQTTNDVTTAKDISNFINVDSSDITTTKDILNDINVDRKKNSNSYEDSNEHFKSSHEEDNDSTRELLQSVKDLDFVFSAQISDYGSDSMALVESSTASDNFKSTTEEFPWDFKVTTDAPTYNDDKNNKTTEEFPFKFKASSGRVNMVGATYVMADYMDNTNILKSGKEPCNITTATPKPSSKIDYAVVILQKVKNKLKRICTGFAITKNFIVTTAHCLPEKAVLYIKYTRPSCPNGYNTTKVTGVFTPPNYRFVVALKNDEPIDPIKSSPLNDIALLKTDDIETRIAKLSAFEFNNLIGFSACFAGYENQSDACDLNFDSDDDEDDDARKKSKKGLMKKIRREYDTNKEFLIGEVARKESGTNKDMFIDKEDITKSGNENSLIDKQNKTKSGNETLLIDKETRRQSGYKDTLVRHTGVIRECSSGVQSPTFCLGTKCDQKEPLKEIFIGGPVVYSTKVVGIVSGIGKEIVVTPISPYLQWISQILDTQSSVAKLFFQVKSS